MGNLNENDKDTQDPNLEKNLPPDYTKKFTEYDTDIYDDKDTPIQKEIKINVFQKPDFKTHSDGILESYEMSPLELKMREKNFSNSSETLSIKSGMITILGGNESLGKISSEDLVKGLYNLKSHKNMNFYYRT